MEKQHYVVIVTSLPGHSFRMTPVVIETVKLSCTEEMMQVIAQHLLMAKYGHTCVNLKDTDISNPENAPVLAIADTYDIVVGHILFEISRDYKNTDDATADEFINNVLTLYQYALECTCGSGCDPLSLYDVISSVPEIDPGKDSLYYLFWLIENRFKVDLRSFLEDDTWEVEDEKID